MDGGLRPAAVHTRLQDAIALVAPAAHFVGSAADDTIITGTCLDSRRVRAGDVYAALPGSNAHGAQFAEQAIDAGAAAILTDADGAQVLATSGLDARVPVVVVDAPRAVLGPLSALAFGKPAERMQVLGVTGTNGKTTVASMVAAGLVAAGRTPGVIGTVGTTIGAEKFAGVRTTPEAPDLHALLGVMAERGVDVVVMEVSSIAVDEHRVDGLVLDAIAFTNLTQDHLDYHGTMENYFDAKARLFAPDHARRGIVGIDDDWGRRLASQARIPVQTWSLADPSAQWHAKREGSGVEVFGTDGAPVRVELTLPGAFNVANAICAFALLASIGIEPHTSAPGIASAVVPGRMQAIDIGGVLGIVDYAHTPDAIERVLRAVRSGASGRVIAVIGAGGNRDATKRAPMGECAARLADVVVVTDDNPRREDPATIRAQVLEGVASVAPARRARVEEAADRRQAITVAVQEAGPGDIVLVLGKGHEQGQEVDGVITPFDDVAELRAALARRAEGSGS